MRVCEIFESIQGEGKYVGAPALFIRLSGCTRNCEWCDTKYHTKGKEVSVKTIIDKIWESGKDIVVWTGGEPMLQIKEIVNVVNKTTAIKHHLETNGDILPPPNVFDYICFSPKDFRTAKNCLTYASTLSSDNWDIKVVTDLRLNRELIPCATMLMPLTTGDAERDRKIRQKVWEYCVKFNVPYCPRLHVEVWGNKPGR